MEMLCIFNPNDDNSCGRRGFAQAYKLLGFEYMIADRKATFPGSCTSVIRLIAGHGARIIKEVDTPTW
jgi:hypothetical protein